MQKYNIVKDILINSERIQNRCSELRKEIINYYKDKIVGNDNLIIIKVMEGGLSVYKNVVYPILNLKEKINFSDASVICKSYYDNSESTNDIKIDTTIIEENPNIFNGHHILIVDDIYDTGKTLYAIKERIESIVTPKSIEFLVMVERVIEEKEYNVDVKFVGFTIDKEDFLIGFGMDFKGQLRDLPYIATINKIEMDKELKLGLYCNNCGCSLISEEAEEYYGLINCEVHGGYYSTYLEDLKSYKFDLCEYCLKTMFNKFKFAPEVNYLI